MVVILALIQIVIPYLVKLLIFLLRGVFSGKWGLVLDELNVRLEKKKNLRY